MLPKPSPRQKLQPNTDLFTYTVKDNTDGVSTDTRMVNLTLVGNNPPVANDDAAAEGAITNESISVLVNVLANDTDADNAVPPFNAGLTIQSVDTTGTTGTAVIEAGQIRYNPNGQFETLVDGVNGTDTFTYTISDGIATSTATVTVTITGVNGDPIANNDSRTTNEDSDTSANVRNNDTDADHAISSLVVTTTGTGLAMTNGGLLDIAADGSYTFKTNGDFEHLRPGETQSSQFTYTIQDPQGKSDTATLTVTVTGVEDAVAANDDPSAGTTDEKNSVTVAGPGVVANDTNAESTPQVSTADTASTEGGIVAVVQQADIGEVGQVLNVDGTAQTISFAQTYTNPVVVALSSQGTPAGNTGIDPDVAAVRIFNVTTGSFQVRLDIPPSGSPAANPETVNYLVIESGEYELANGLRLKAGTQSVGVGDTAINFGGTIGFGATPVALTQVMSDNDSAYIKVRHRAGINTSGVTVFLEEAEAAAAHGSNESVGYIAIEPGQGTINGVAYEVGNTPNSVTQVPFNLNFANTYASLPLFVADMQTIDGADASGLRWRNNTGSGLTGGGSGTDTVTINFGDNGWAGG